MKLILSHGWGKINVSENPCGADLRLTVDMAGDNTLLMFLRGAAAEAPGGEAACRLTK